MRISNGSSNVCSSDLAVLQQVANDRDFLEDYHRALTSFDSYLADGARPDVDAHLRRGHNLVAYFCAAFGLHETLPIYSGGLGILAADHCKAISDHDVQFLARGLLDLKGYFTIPTPTQC